MAVALGLQALVLGEFSKRLGPQNAVARPGPPSWPAFFIAGPEHGTGGNSSGTAISDIRT